MKDALPTWLDWFAWNTAWWAFLALIVSVWFRVRTPRSPAVRHAAIAGALFAGILFGVLPRWGSGWITIDARAGKASRVQAPASVASSLPAADDALESELDSTLTTDAEIEGGALTKVARRKPTTPRTLSSVSSESGILGTAGPLLLAVWIAGALLLGLRFAAAMRTACRWRREAVALSAEEQQVFQRLKTELAVRRPAETASHQDAATPLVLCGRPPLVLVPNDWCDWRKESRLAGWRHELMHIRRYDDWWRMLGEALRVVWWFHPGVRWLISRQEHEAELLADDAAVASGCPPEDLARALIEACRRSGQPGRIAAASVFFARGTTNTRIARLMDVSTSESVSRPAPRGLRFTTAAVAVALALLGSMRWASIADAAAVDPPPTKEISSAQKIPPKKVESEPDSKIRIPNAVALPSNKATNQKQPPLPAARIAPDKRKLDYVVEAPDVLYVEALKLLPNHPIQGERLVRQDGTVGLGVYGNLSVEGLTLREVENKLRETLQKHVPDPQVYVDVASINSKVFYVLGQVQQVGRLPFTGMETVLDAIVLSGGITNEADPDAIVLSRPNPGGGSDEILRIDWQAIVVNGDTRRNYQMRSGDRIYVGRKKLAGANAPPVEVGEAANEVAFSSILPQSAPTPWNSGDLEIVLRGKDGNPVEKATIWLRLSPSLEIRGTTNAFGTCEFKALESGQYSLSLANGVAGRRTPIGVAKVMPGRKTSISADATAKQP